MGQAKRNRLAGIVNENPTVKTIIAAEVEMLKWEGVTGVACFFTPKQPVLIALTEPTDPKAGKAVTQAMNIFRNKFPGEMYPGLEFDIVIEARLDGWTKSFPCRLRAMGGGTDIVAHNPNLNLVN